MPGPARGLSLEIHVARRLSMGREWNYSGVVSPFFRLYAIHSAAAATVAHGGRTWELDPRRLHLVPAFTRSDYRCGGHLDHTYLHVSATTATGQDLSRALALPAELAATPERLARMERIRAAHGRSDLASHLAAEGELRLLLADFCVGVEPVVAPADPLSDLAAWIIDHLDSPLPLHQLAGRLDLRPSWFAERFRARFGRSPAAWLRERRLERAARLLGEGLRIEVVAARCGWSDRGYFTRCFTRRFGVGPATWRRLRQPGMV